MPYDPTLYTPYRGYQTGPGVPISQPSWYYQPTQTQMQQPYDMRIKVKGLNGAKAFQMPPNSHAVLFDEDSDVLYYKATDAAGYPSIVDFDFYPRELAPASPAPDVDYVPRSEFDKLARAVDDLMSNLGVKEAHDGE